MTGDNASNRLYTIFSIGNAWLYNSTAIVWRTDWIIVGPKQISTINSRNIYYPTNEWVLCTMHRDATNTVRIFAGMTLVVEWGNVTGPLGALDGYGLYFGDIPSTTGDPSILRRDRLNGCMDDVRVIQGMALPGKYTKKKIQCTSRQRSRSQPTGCLSCQPHYI